MYHHPLHNYKPRTTFLQHHLELPDLKQAVFQKVGCPDFIVNQFGGQQRQRLAQPKKGMLALKTYALDEPAKWAVARQLVLEETWQINGRKPN